MKNFWTIFMLLIRADAVASCDEAGGSTCLLQLSQLKFYDKVRQTHESSSAQTRVLIVLRTRYQNLDTRLKASRDTWMQRLGEDDKLLVFVADPGLKTQKGGTAPTLQGVEVTPIDCPDSHNVGLNCEMSEVFRFVLPMVADEKYDALFVVDDDAYLDVPNLKTAVKGMNGPVAFGIWGCAEPPYYGFCGGGGYGLTQEATRKLLHAPDLPEQLTAGGGASTGKELGTAPWRGKEGRADDFVTRYLNASQAIYDLPKHSAWEDVAFGVTVKSLGLKTETLPGLYGWALKGEQYNRAVRSCHPLPVNFHYVTEETKRKLHGDLAGLGCSAETAHKTAGTDLALRQEAWYVSVRDAALQDGSVKPVGYWH